MRRTKHIPAFQAWTAYLMAWLDRRAADMVTTDPTLGPLKIQEDPEAIFQEGWLLCDVGELKQGLGLMQRAVAKGYYPVATLAVRPQFDALRDTPEFRQMFARAEAGRDHALEQFRAAGGPRLLGA
jgi:hypothetical protein